jgi:hypothetical protein
MKHALRLFESMVLRRILGSDSVETAENSIERGFVHFTSHEL